MNMICLIYSMLLISLVKGDCNYNGRRYATGTSFPATDGCNTCNCGYNGVVGCTKIGCPPAHTGQCPTLPPGTIGSCISRCTTDTQCPSTHKCCSNGCGSECKLAVRGNLRRCNYNGIIYNHGASFPSSDGCNTCNCYDSQVSCTERACPPTQRSCTYNGVVYNHGASFPSSDGCNTCNCYDSQVTCTERACIPSQRSCTYNGIIYNHGASFPSTDGCNTCHCYDSRVSCTLMACQPPQYPTCAATTCITGTYCVESPSGPRCVLADNYPCPGPEVQCFVRPCTVAAHCNVAGAVCIDDYCDGCNAVWLFNGRRVCEPSHY